ncbi:MAG: hypothetical protein ICV64_00480 [Thermoleophilia bacterium]|nr:hypothetical protein [Thermoleophilia bacterium]
MGFWTDIFTVETWSQAGQREFRVSGFPPPTPGRGGYFTSTFAAVEVGDVLACYVKAPAQRWVGMLRVESPMFLDYDDALWGTGSDGRALFPARFETSPLIALPVEQGLPVQATLGVLRCMDPRSYSGMFRRSLKRMPAEDGAKLMELLSEPREASPVRLPRKRPKRIPPPAIERPADELALDSERRGRATPHTELVWKLITLGKALGCDVWVAPDERGKSFDGHDFAGHVLKAFPPVGVDPASAEVIRSIDVLWIRGRTIVAAFEVEATTSIYSGLLRMSDLVALQPNTSIDLFIVAPDERRSKVYGEITRPTFESFDPPLRDRCRYLSASNVDAALERTRPPLNRYLQPGVVREFSEEARFEDEAA